MDRRITDRLAVDPGDIHVGWCSGRLIGGEQWDVICEELTPEECIRRLDTWLGLRVGMELHHEVIAEEFVLYAGQDQRNVGNRMKTSELIGKMEFVCQLYGTELLRQPASIKKPTRAQLRGRGIKQVGHGTHQRDAELHFWYRTLRSCD